jgi:SpoVK/Ycf46/Vps4 family AAA+-type ATPase
MFNFISVDVSDILRSHVGESEKELSRVFALARQHGPCIIFFDEVQSIFRTRSGEHSEGSRVVTQFIFELDRCHQAISSQTTMMDYVTVIASTNLPDALDAALMRPGRFDRVLYVPPPDLDARRIILHAIVSRMRVDNDLDIDGLATATELFSGADLHNLCSTAVSCAMKRVCGDTRRLDRITSEDFQDALKQCHPHLTTEMIEEYQSFRVSRPTKNKLN